MTKGKSLRGRHLFIAERASIILIILKRRNYKTLWRRKERRSITTDVSLSACNASYPSVHLTHLISEIVKTTTKIRMHPRVTPTMEEEEGGTAEAAGLVTPLVATSVEARPRFTEQNQH